jgi:uncharacterized integral membrane protein (TIGR00698 family)
MMPGVAWAARLPLEVAIVLLGASTDLRQAASGGWPVFAGVVAVVAVSLGAGVAIGRLCGLSRTHALLVASGNAICGNSAIAAVASVLKAPARETASSIAFTALLSVGLVLVLPIAGLALALDDRAYGTLAGLTVYAVPQVLAATYPVSALAGEVATLVKLVRVMLLVPWLLLLAVVEHRGVENSTRGVWRRVLPWYLVAFLALAALHTVGAVPEVLVPGARATSHALTVVAMAALGLTVDPASLREVGWRTACATLAALAALAGAALLVALRV